MSAISVLNDAEGGIPIIAVAADRLAAWLEGQPARVAAWVNATGFKADSGATLLLSDADGALDAVLLGLGRGDDPWSTGGLAKALPKGRYRLSEIVGLAPAYAARFPTWAALAWALGAYHFGRYRKDTSVVEKLASLKWPEGCDRASVTRTVDAAVLTRDLINTPAADMLPDSLAKAAADVAARHGAACKIIVGDDLPKDGLSPDSRRRTRRRSRAASHRFYLGRRRRSQGHAGREGRLLRYRRTRSQTLQRHGADEKGHGRCGNRAGSRRHDHGRSIAGAPAGFDSGSRECRRR
jgi:hypothetical protein